MPGIALSVVIGRYRSLSVAIGRYRSLSVAIGRLILAMSYLDAAAQGASVSLDLIVKLLNAASFGKAFDNLQCERVSLALEISIEHLGENGVGRHLVEERHGRA